MVVYRPIDIKEALNKLMDNELYILNGGTDLMVKKKADPGLIPNFDKDVMFISQLKELKDIYLEDGYIHIGSGCTYSELLKSGLIPKVMKSPMKEIASPAIRNLATIGGNICNASPAADILPILYALEAKVVLANYHLERELPIEDFILGPSKNALLSNELCIRIKVPQKPFNRFYYKKVGTRKATAIAKLSFIGLAQVQENKINDIRISFGAVGPTIIKSKDIERELFGMDVVQIIRELEIYKSKYGNLINPISDQRSKADYRRRVSLNLYTDFIKSLNS